MDSKKLEALAAAAEHGSFTRAAQQLGYTQSGLTHMMNSLEREIGFPVLVRDRRGVHLTPAGQRILPMVQQCLAANQALERGRRCADGFRKRGIPLGAGGQSRYGLYQSAGKQHAGLDAAEAGSAAGDPAPRL